MKLYRFFGLLLRAGTIHAQVTFDRLLNALHEPELANLRGNLSPIACSIRFNRDNVKNLGFEHCQAPHNHHIRVPLRRTL
jgi:hypothetical protein